MTCGLPPTCWTVTASGLWEREMSSPVFDAVLVRGETWSASAFVVNDWYITAYRPIRDPGSEDHRRAVCGHAASTVVYRRNVLMAIFLGGVMLSTIVVLGLLMGVTHWVLQPIGKILDMCHRVIGAIWRPAWGFGRPASSATSVRPWMTWLRHCRSANSSWNMATKQHIGRSEKLASIGRLAAGLAHEINNPLTGVLTFAHLVRDRSPGRWPGPRGSRPDHPRDAAGGGSRAGIAGVRPRTTHHQTRRRRQCA